MADLWHQTQDIFNTTIDSFLCLLDSEHRVGAGQNMDFIPMVGEITQENESFTVKLDGNRLTTNPYSY